MVRRILIFIIFCVSAINVWSQYDPQFSQNMFNMLNVNPGYAGSSESINLVALNRNQWTGDYAIKTTVFSGDMPINLLGLNSGVGLSVMNDEIGFFTNLSMMLSYAMKFDFEKGELGVGVNLGLINQSLNPKWKFPSLSNTVYDKTDDNLPKSQVSGSAFDAGLGVYYQSSKYYGSVSLSHLTKPSPDYKDEMNFIISRTFYVSGGYNIKVEDTAYEILPSFFYKTDGASFQIDLNTLIKYRKRYWGGLTYRYQDAIVLLGGIELLNGVRFGYSYDITTSAIATAGNGGTHELMIGYNFDINFEKRTKRYKSVRYL